MLDCTWNTNFERTSVHESHHDQFPRLSAATYSKRFSAECVWLQLLHCRAARCGWHLSRHWWQSDIVEQCSGRNCITAQRLRERCPGRAYRCALVQSMDSAEYFLSWSFKMDQLLYTKAARIYYNRLGVFGIILFYLMLFSINIGKPDLKI